MKQLLDKWNNIPESAKSSIAFIFCTLLIKGIVFLVTPLFTRIMDIEDYGIVATYNSWITIIEIFAILGLTSAGVFNVGLKDNKDKRNEYISSCMGLCNVTTIIVFSIIFLSKIKMGKDFILDNRLLVVMFVHFIFNPAQIFWITRQRYEYKYKMATVITILSSIIAQIASIIGVILMKNDAAFFKILGNEIGLLLFTVPIYIMLIIRGKKYINLKQWKNILILSLPLIPHYLSQHVLASSDRIMISDFVSKGDAAIYEVVSNISLIGTIFWNAVNASLIPYMFEKIEKKEYISIRNICKKLLIGYIIILFGVLLIAPEILSILAPEKYHKGIYCIPPLTIVIFLNALYNFFANVEFYHKKTKSIALATVASAIVNVALNIVLIPKYSYVAAAYTTLVSTIVLIMFHYWGYKKTETNEIFDVKFIIKISLFFFIISELCNLLYLNIIARIIFIILVVICVFFKRESLMNIIKELMRK